MTLYRIDRRSYFFAVALVAVALLLPACAGSEDETVGETPPTLLVAEHPVTSEAARRAGIVDDGVVDEGMDGDGVAEGGLQEGDLQEDDRQEDAPAAEGPSLDAPVAEDAATDG